jgi:hypothetical protein
MDTYARAAPAALALEPSFTVEEPPTVAVYRAQISVPQDSALPRDRIVITPHFRRQLGALTGGDDQDLTNDLADAIGTWFGQVGVPSREVDVRLYDAEHVATADSPGLPVARTTRNAGTFVQSAVPREVAVCLSFYAGLNIQRRRGRIYVPAPFLYGSGISGSRPAADKRDAVGLLAGIFANLGGPDIDWVVWSRRDREARPVTNWWVDDEFDVQRRRGLRSTTRLTGTTTEAGTPITP